VAQARADVDEFLKGNTPLVFGVDYSSLSMSDVVPQAEIRDKLRAATQADEDGNRTEAMALLLQAFHELFDPHQRQTHAAFGEEQPIRPFELGGRVSRPMSERDIASVLSLSPEQARRAPTRGNQSLAAQISSVTKVASATQEAVRMLGLGIDYYRYARFLALTPMYVPTFGDPNGWHAPDGYAPNDEEYEYCQQFVVEVALRFASIESHLTLPSWARAGAESDPA
jgi:hypothetical protein